MHAGFESFRNFEQDAQDFAELAKTPLTMLVLELTGEKASGNFLSNKPRLTRQSQCRAQGKTAPLWADAREVYSVGFVRHRSRSTGANLVSDRALAILF
jgi:hypothetical protein